MIHIRENLVGEDQVQIRVAGVLDEKSVLLLRDLEMIPDEPLWEFVRLREYLKKTHG